VRSDGETPKYSNQREPQCRLRWQVETSLAQLKAIMQMDVLHGKTALGALKELTVFDKAETISWPSGWTAVDDVP
jgi:hypothetical protein